MFSGLVLAVAIALLLCFNNASANDELDWWESATYYQVYPRSFMDSNGDGVGDLNGITYRLNYLKEIGITAAWISPIFESPMLDNGYDITNFTNIDPIFGTMDDFDALLDKAHKLGIKIVLDFVPNHSSDKCEWFQKSIRREEGYEDFYVWNDGKIDEKTGERIPPSNFHSIFNGSAWTWNEERQQYYLHQFLVEQPDFNMTNPKVREHLIEVLKFWLDRGVDAFRIDAVQFFVEKRFANGTYPDNPSYYILYQLDQPENPEFLYEWREFLDKYQQLHGGETRAMVAESYAAIPILSDYISNGTHFGSQMPMNLNFVKLEGLINAKVIEDQANKWMSQIWAQHKTANWITGNHDNNRLATRMGQNRVDMMTMIFHALPGASMTYYGDEIGMTDGATGCLVNCNFRDPSRTPMQWDNSVNAGFNTGNSTWLPVNPNYEFLNVKTQRGTARSSLQIFKGMIKFRQTSAFKAFKEDGAFNYGALKEQVFHVMRTDKATQEYRVLANFGNQIEYVESLTNKTMEYVLLNSYSPHKMGDKIDLSKRIYLMPFEAIVLRWTA